MAEPYRSEPLLNPRALHSAATLDDGAEVASRLLVSDDADEVADLMEHAVDKSERAHAVIYALLAKCRGWETTSGVEMVADATGPASRLIVPGSG